jgi:hypothetical protein
MPPEYNLGFAYGTKTEHKKHEKWVCKSCELANKLPSWDRRGVAPTHISRFLSQNERLQNQLEALRQLTCLDHPGAAVCK